MNHRLCCITLANNLYHPLKALLNYTEDDYPEIEGLRKEVVRRRIRKLKMRLKFCTPQTCQKCAKMIVKDYNTPKKVLDI